MLDEAMALEALFKTDQCIGHPHVRVLGIWVQPEGSVEVCWERFLVVSSCHGVFVWRFWTLTLATVAIACGFCHLCILKRIGCSDVSSYIVSSTTAAEIVYLCIFNVYFYDTSSIVSIFYVCKDSGYCTDAANYALSIILHPTTYLACPCLIISKTYLNARCQLKLHSPLTCTYSVVCMHARQHTRIEQNPCHIDSLGGGFKYFLCSPYLGKVSDSRNIFFRWVVQPPTSSLLYRRESLWSGSSEPHIAPQVLPYLEQLFEWGVPSGQVFQ